MTSRCVALAPARGVAIAALVSLPVWALVIWAIRRWMS